MRPAPVLGGSLAPGGLGARRPVGEAGWTCERAAKSAARETPGPLCHLSLMALPSSRPSDAALLCLRLVLREPGLVVDGAASSADAPQWRPFSWH